MPQIKFGAKNQIRDIPNERKEEMYEKPIVFETQTMRNMDNVNINSHSHSHSHGINSHNNNNSNYNKYTNILPYHMSNKNINENKHSRFSEREKPKEDGIAESTQDIALKEDIYGWCLHFFVLCVCVCVCVCYICLELTLAVKLRITGINKKITNEK